MSLVRMCNKALTIRGRGLPHGMLVLKISTAGTEGR